MAKAEVFFFKTKLVQPNSGKMEKIVQALFLFKYFDH